MASEILVTGNDIGQRRTDPDHRLEDFRGVNAQIVIDTNDNHRIAVMDGYTKGGKSHAALLESAPFTSRPTAPSHDGIAESIPDSELTTAKDTRAIVEYILSTGDDSVIEVLKNKLDHTLVKNGADVNTLTDDGIYHVTNASNAPTTDGILHTYADGSALFQIYYTNTPDGVKVYHRSNSLNGFSSWLQYAVANADNNFSTTQSFQKDIRVDGKIIGGGMAKKLDHTLHNSTCQDLNSLRDDGIYHFSSATNVINRPSDDIYEFFVHVFDFETTTVQVVYTLDGKVYTRGVNSSSDFSPWSGTDFDFPEASLSQKGIVQLQTTINDAEDKAATPKAVNQAYTKATEAERSAQSNENNITKLNSKVDEFINNYNKSAFVKTVEGIAPDTAGNVKLHSASEVEEGIIAVATQEEVEAGTDNTKAVTPHALSDFLKNTGISESVRLEVVNSIENVTEQNVIYFITE